MLGYVGIFGTFIRVLPFSKLHPTNILHFQSPTSYHFISSFIYFMSSFTSVRKIVWSGTPPVYNHTGCWRQSKVCTTYYTTGLLSLTKYHQGQKGSGTGDHLSLAQGPAYYWNSTGGSSIAKNRCADIGMTLQGSCHIIFSPNRGNTLDRSLYVTAHRGYSAPTSPKLIQFNSIVVFF